MAATHQLADAGFHTGELAVQRRAGVEQDAARLAPMVEPAGLFAMTFVISGTRPRDCCTWSSSSLATPVAVSGWMGAMVGLMCGLPF